MFPLRGLGHALLAVTMLVLAACSSGGGQNEESVDVPAGWVRVETAIGSLARPQEWRPQPAPESEAAEIQSFAIETRGGELVAQMDVLVNAMDPGTQADTVDAVIQGVRMPSFPQLEHTRREFAEVPGADSAFLTESTYVTADTGDDARSLDQVAVLADGRYLLVRLSARADAYDEKLFTQVVETVRLSADGAAS